jgi:hypothetical protein
LSIRGLVTIESLIELRRDVRKWVKVMARLLFGAISSEITFVISWLSVNYVLRIRSYECKLFITWGC